MFWLTGLTCPVAARKSLSQSSCELGSSPGPCRCHHRPPRSHTDAGAGSMFRRPTAHDTAGPGDAAPPQPSGLSPTPLSDAIPPHGGGPPPESTSPLRLGPGDGRNGGSTRQGQVEEPLTGPDVGVGSDRGALPAFQLVGFPGPPSEPDVQLRVHPALHVLMPLLVQPVSASHVPAARPRRGQGHGAPVFTSGLRDQQFGYQHTGPLRHVTGFPDLGPLVRVLRPTPPASAGNKPSRRPARFIPRFGNALAGSQHVGGTRAGSQRSTQNWDYLVDRESYPNRFVPFVKGIWGVTTLYSGPGVLPGYGLSSQKGHSVKAPPAETATCRPPLSAATSRPRNG